MLLFIRNFEDPEDSPEGSQPQTSPSMPVPLAGQQGTSAEAVIDLMVGHAEERLAGAVADERLTQAEADEKLADITEKITDKVNNGGFGPGFGPGHRHGPDGEGFGGRGFGGRGPGGQGFGFGQGAPEAPAADAINA